MEIIKATFFARDQPLIYFFAQYCIFNLIEDFIVNELVDVVAFCEAFYQLL